MENVYDKILKDQGLNYEDLSIAEREIYNKANFDSKKLSLGDIKNYLSYMKNSIALQLASTPEKEGTIDEELFLKARLKNYILLEAFLLLPEKAEEAFRKQVKMKGSD